MLGCRLERVYSEGVSVRTFVLMVFFHEYGVKHFGFISQGVSGSVERLPGVAAAVKNAIFMGPVSIKFVCEGLAASFWA